MPTPPEELLAAIDQFRVWLRWYLHTYSEQCPSQADLARKIGVDRATITNLLKPSTGQVPKLQTLWAFSRLLGFTMDYILTRNPPNVRKGQFGATKNDPGSAP